MASYELFLLVEGFVEVNEKNSMVRVLTVSFLKCLFVCLLVLYSSLVFDQNEDDLCHEFSNRERELIVFTTVST